jgi:hypothetical protein
MANITITIIIDGLDNDDIDVMPEKVEKVLSDAVTNGKLAGKIDTVEELDREEDEEEETEE